MRLVRRQLAAFKEGMARDAGQQRAEVGRLVASTTKKAADIVDETLQVLLWGVLLCFTFRSCR